MATKSKTGSLKFCQIVSILHCSSPTSALNYYKEACKWDHWEITMSEETNVLCKQETWILVPPSKEVVLGSKSVYKIKMNVDVR